MLLALRVIVGVLALLLLLAGLAALASGRLEGLSGFWLILLGAAGLIAVVFERLRYGSESTDRSGGGSAEAGIDTGPLDSRFQVTNERFVDPTTQRRIRVWVDPASGERRYRPDE
jgi:hypothetical protein